MKKMFVVLIVLLMVPAQANSEGSVDGNKLLSQCKDGRSQQYCLGFITGVWFTVISNHAITLRAVTRVYFSVYKKAPFYSVWKICSPQGVTNGQVRDVVIKFLNENPKERHLKAPSLVVRAMQGAWPCVEAPLPKIKPSLK